MGKSNSGKKKKKVIQKLTDTNEILNETSQVTEDKQNLESKEEEEETIVEKYDDKNKEIEQTKEGSEVIIKIDGVNELLKPFDSTELIEETMEENNISDKNQKTINLSKGTTSTEKVIEKQQEQEGNKPQKENLIEKIEENNLQIEHLDANGDDFGNFSDASFDDFEEDHMEIEPQSQQTVEKNTQKPAQINEDILNLNNCTFEDSKKLSTALDSVFKMIYPGLKSSDLEIKSAKDQTEESHRVPKDIFSARSAAIWNELKVIPKLNPPDWKRGSIRRHFLISIGIPIDLDELNTETHTKKPMVDNIQKKYKIVYEDVKQTKNKTIEATKEKSEDENFVKRDCVTLPDEKEEKDNTMRKEFVENRVLDGIKNLEINDNEDTILIKQPKTLRITELESKKIEESTESDIIDIEHFIQSEAYYNNLLATKPDELQQALVDLKTAKHKMMQTLSVWNHKLEALKEDQETFEAVIENVVGYTQKLRRQETFEEKLKELKKMSKKVLLPQPKRVFFGIN